MAAIIRTIAAKINSNCLCMSAGDTNRTEEETFSFLGIPGI